MRNSLELKKAHRRLTIINTLITGTILSIIVWLMFGISLTAYKNQMQLEFYAKADSIVNEVENLTTINNAWLSQLEEQDELLIELKENGASLVHHASWMKQKQRNQLFSGIIEKAAQQGLDITNLNKDSDHILKTYCVISLDHIDYIGVVAQITNSNGNARSVLLAKQIAVRSSFIHNLFLKYLIINVLGVLLFGFLSYILIAKMLKPVKVANERQGEFIACASHELKSPVAVIRSSAETIKIDEEQRNLYLENIESECARMAHLVDDLLFLTRSDGATQWITSQDKVSMDTLLVEVFDSYYAVFRKADMKLELEMDDEEIGTFQGDKERIKQVLFILLDNAISYTKEDDTVILHGYQKKNVIGVSVTDHGVGVEEKEKKKIFDRFYRSNQVQDSKHHTGLGLSIAKEILRLHHGKIEIEDTPGGGCTFYFELPIVND